MVGPTGPLAQTSVPPPLPCFPVRTALGLGLLFFLKTQLKRNTATRMNMLCWIPGIPFKFNVLEFGFKHRKELPLEISAWSSDYQAL